MNQDFYQELLNIISKEQIQIEEPMREPYHIPGRRTGRVLRAAEDSTGSTGARQVVQGEGDPLLYSRKWKQSSGV